MKLEWYDIVSIILLYVLGTWKLWELISKVGNRFEKWLDRKTKARFEAYYRISEDGFYNINGEVKFKKGEELK